MAGGDFRLALELPFIEFAWAQSSEAREVPVDRCRGLDPVLVSPRPQRLIFAYRQWPEDNVAVHSLGHAPEIACRGHRRPRAIIGEQSIYMFTEGKCDTRPLK